MAKEISIIRQEAQQVQNATQVGENTAQRVGGVLTDLVDKIATILGATYMGVATPTTNPGSPDGNVFYFATQAGTYTNFGSVVLTEGLNILLWNGTSWAVTNVMNIVQELGTSENAVMSQKAVTDAILNKIDLSAIDFDAQTIAKLALATIPTRYNVIRSNKSVGIMEVFSDNIGHMVTEVFDTHYIVENGALTDRHSDDKAFRYMRSYHLVEGGTSDIPVGTWGEWKQVYSSDDQKDVDALKTGVNNLNANTGVADYPVFSQSEAYTAGDVVNYQGKLYQFTADHAAGAWTGSDAEDYSMKKNIENNINEVNVSKIYPTGGIGGTNKYTLETAIVKVPVSLRNVGIKCSFLDTDGTSQTWQYMGGTFTDAGNWEETDAKSISENKMKVVELKGFLLDVSGGLEKGDYYYDNKKQLRKVLIPGSKTEVVPFSRSAIYRFNDELYVYDGDGITSVDKSFMEYRLPKYIQVKYTLPAKNIQSNVMVEGGILPYDSPVSYYPLKFISLMPVSNISAEAKVYCDALEKAWMKIINDGSEFSFTVVLSVLDGLLTDNTFGSYFLGKAKVASDRFDGSIPPEITSLTYEPTGMVEIPVKPERGVASAIEFVNATISNYKEIHPFYARYSSADNLSYSAMTYLASKNHEGTKVLAAYAHSPKGVTFNGILVRLLPSEETPYFTDGLTVRLLDNMGSINKDILVPLDYVKSILKPAGYPLARYYELPVFFNEDVTISGDTELMIQIWRNDGNTLSLNVVRESEYIADPNSPLVDGGHFAIVGDTSKHDSFKKLSLNNFGFYLTLIQGVNKGLIDTDIVFPQTVYTVLNDIKNNVALGNNTEAQTKQLLRNDNIAASVYLDHCFRGYDREPSLKFENGSTRMAFYSNLTKTTINDGVEKATKTVRIRLVGENCVAKHLSINHVSTLASVGKNDYVKLLIISASTGAYVPLDFYDTYQQDNSFIVRIKELFERDKIDNGDSGYELFSMGYTAEGGNIHTRNMDYDGVRRGIRALGYCIPGASLESLIKGINFTQAYDSEAGRFSVKHLVDNLRTRDDDTMEKYEWGDPLLGKGVTEYDLSNGRVDMCTPTHVVIMLGPNDINNIAGYEDNVKSVIESIVSDYPGDNGGTSLKVAFCVGDSGVISYPTEYKKMLPDNYDWLCRKGFYGSDDNRHYPLWKIAKILNGFDTDGYKNKNVYVIPTFFVGNPEVSGRKINTPGGSLLKTDDYFIGAYDNTHVNAQYHCDWAYQIYAWIKSTLVE